MNELNFRQVHLDFHTSPFIDGIGAKFSREQFAQALKAGHVNSITVFSKCHHGYAYHPSTANEMHPGLTFDLLGEQLAVCRELGVKAPVYISAGLDEKYAEKHPEYVVKGKPDDKVSFEGSGYHLLCYNTPYLDYLIGQIEEVMQRYNPCGIFLDISNVRNCRCQSCVDSMKRAGLDPDNPADVRKHNEEVYANYCRRVEEAVRKYSADATIFHNAGNIDRGRRDIAHFDTHLELESLPTGGWGYDHFPMSAAYVRTLGMEYLGMTGKFHTTWGEFGGFKHPNALRYETALSIALGAKCSIGDQLHPCGEMNMSTYKLIGAAYAEVEQKEKWCCKAKAISDIAVLSAAAVAGQDSRNSVSDTGICRMLLEKKYLFDLIDTESDFNDYKCLILPDAIRLDEALRDRLNDFLAKGGKLMLSGESGLAKGSDEFAIEVGALYSGANRFRPSYMSPTEALASEGFVNGVTEYVMYEQGYNIEPKPQTEVTAYLVEPYFNREGRHFSSHQHTPNRPGSLRPAAVLSSNVAYIGWKLFTDYAQKGELHLKELAMTMLERLLGDDRTMRVEGMPDRGIVTLMAQPEENRLVNHLLYAHTSKRGNGIEVIEDVVPLYDIKVSIKLDRAPRCVYLAPCGSLLEHKYENGVLSYTVPKVDIHQMVVIDR